MNAYAYRALEGPEYIRLIVLHPALSKATPLRIDFVSSKLKDVEGDYDAVSYTWGEPVLTFPLYVGEDGMQVYITENLDRALRYLRYETRERMLWADAACINQKDNEEKAIQIPLMVQIFRGARRVMAWLDPGGDTTVEQKGMRLLDRISRLSNTTRTDRSYKHFSTVLQFLNLPWFNRLWIVQEVVFNVEVCLICGEVELPFSRLVSALSIIKRQDSWHELGGEAKSEAIVEIGRLWNIYSLFRENNTEEETDVRGETQILPLLEKFGLYECTDPRDRIFALCSMANDVRPIGDWGETDVSYLKYFSTMTEDDPIRIDVNYSLGVGETYEAFALACLMEATSATLIWTALLTRRHSPPPINWPSWVPDWRVPPQKIKRGCCLESESSDYHVRRIAPGILCVSVPVTRSILDGKEKKLYTVNFKISKNTKSPHMSFDSQLSQLYQMLQIPEAVQGAHPLLFELASMPRKLNPMTFPNLLAKMIKEYVPDCGDEDQQFYSKLEDYLARISIEPNLQCSSKPSSGYIQGFIEELEQALANENTLFCFRDPGTGVNSVGYGNVALELGDLLLPLHSRLYRMYRGDLTAKHVLMLRPVYTMDTLNGEKQVYRLVGDARIFDPTEVLMSIEYERQYEALLAKKDSKVGKFLIKMRKDPKALLSSFECQTFNQVVYLA
jgi:hypothetical protein